MERKIKILTIVNRFNLGGLVYIAAFLTRYLSDDFETLLIGGVPDEGEADAYHILKEYEIEAIVIPELQRPIRFGNDYKAYRKIKKIIQEFQPDVVHTHASKAGFVGRYAAIRCHVPVVLHTFHGHVFHSYFGKAKTTLFIALERYLAARTNGIITISNSQKEELVNTYKITRKEKAYVIPLGFDLEKFTIDKEQRRKQVRAEYNLKEEEVAIAICGRLTPVKDHDYFLNVIEELAKTTTTPIRVFIVGDGTEKERVAERVKEINQQFSGLIEMTSWIKDIATFNQGMDIIALTSKNEGTPVSIIEALASKVAVISTDVGGIRDVVEDEVSGYVINRENIETYIDKLRLLVEQPLQREMFSENGYHKVMEDFSYKHLVKDTEDLYKSLLKR